MRTTLDGTESAGLTRKARGAAAAPQVDVRPDPLPEIPVATSTRSKTYRLPVDVLDRIESIRADREAAAREHLPPELHDTVKVQEVDIVKLLLLRGLDALDAEHATDRPKATRKRKR